MRFELASTFLASTGGVLEYIPKQWRGLVALGTVALLSYGAGVFTSDTIEGMESLEPRVTELETWRGIHTDTVTGPGLARIGRLEDQQSAISEQVGRIESMVYRMYCAEYPGECDGVPR